MKKDIFVGREEQKKNENEEEKKEKNECFLFGCDKIRRILRSQSMRTQRSARTIKSRGSHKLTVSL